VTACASRDFRADLWPRSRETNTAASTLGVRPCLALRNARVGNWISIQDPFNIHRNNGVHEGERTVKYVYVTSPQDPLLSEQTKLSGDLQILRVYGDEHPDEWTEVFFENEPTVRLVALIASPSLEVHERVLQELVSYPDQLVVREANYSSRQLEGMRQIVQNMPEFREQRFLSVGIGRGQLQVSVQPNQERLAAALSDRFGDGIRLKVGALPYPMPPEVKRRTPCEAKYLGIRTSLYRRGQH